jgi:hypothetical protein
MSKTDEPVSSKVLFRDREVYRVVMKRATFGEKAALLDTFERRGYLAYQRALHGLARRKGIEVWSAR